MKATKKSASDKHKSAGKATARGSKAAGRAGKAAGHEDMSVEDENTLIERENTSVERENTSAIDILAEDHRRVERVFKDFEELKEHGASAKAKGGLVREACDLLTVHAAIEEEVFYPAARRAIHDDDLMDEADVEHAGAKRLISELEAMSPGDSHYDAKFLVLAEQVRHHIREEEGKMFVKARASKMNLDAVGRQLLQRREELMRDIGLGDEAMLALYTEMENRSGTRII